MEENEGLSLLKKGRRGLIRMVFSRCGLMVLLMLLQVLLLAAVYFWFSGLLPHYMGIMSVFVVIMVLYLLNSNFDPTAKITWLVLIMAAPVFGTLLLWYTNGEVGHRALKVRMDQLVDQTKDAIPQDPEAAEALRREDPGAAGLAAYLTRSDCHPVYRNTRTEYFPSGEAKWARMLRELEQAEKFIFMEYFIVDEGLMWGRILEILARKAKEGVQVRVMYDGTCEFTTLPHNYPKRLQEMGIQCKSFAPLVPLVSTHYNYRDHRKILVIDGRVAFTGGVNLADEYINHVQLHGHWKDTAVMVTGDAVRTFTLLFLQMWNLDEREPEFRPWLDAPVDSRPSAPGFVVPYGDRPLDTDKVGERVYMDILNRSTGYVYIMTPYLILDGELETALKFAAERGVDVELILPGIPDKKAPYALAKSHYAALLASGVKIYEYTPGFVHAKVCVSDSREAVVGTINLDYRSLYHHFECAAWMYRTECIGDIEADFLATREKCRRVTPQTIWQGSRGLKTLSWLMKAVAPLM